jgi:hypothetical protein
MKRLIILGATGLLVAAALMSATTSASPRTTRFRTIVYVIGNLYSQADGTEVITGGLSSNHACLRNRRITVYDASGVARGAAVSGSGGVASGSPGDWQAAPYAGGSFPPGTYYATAAHKRLGGGRVCKFGRSPNRVVEH